ncbi:hypothetical protein TSAR_014459 [Trichomalopsis sarcophagae]|uniref:Protein kinase domain-containing protein n=1 Tax=Trichomalopsis sarcophagae TaxID=543379 RepID=A0A232F7V7_9HYME|nr:hypothetical protein TSAR_014459 [Trichomalopsis sarcophagae]
MATDPLSKGKQSNQNSGKKDEHGESESKLTVLENHGYTLGKTIGVGTFATVKIAKSERHGYQVAVKIVSKFQAPSANLNKFLPSEIEVVKGLRHPHLIRFLQAIETSHSTFFPSISEFTLSWNSQKTVAYSIYFDATNLSTKFAVAVGIDSCSTLLITVTKEESCTDVKCENLLMDRHYNLKLSDFGFARGHMKSTNGVAPLCETMCGSFAYSSPEILRGIPYQPQLSDIWSSGVVLYTMVFGRMPFDEDNWSRLLKQVQSKIVFPESPKVSQECRNLILRILVPQRSRPRICEIQNDVWLAIPTATAQTSTDDDFLGESSNSAKSQQKSVSKKSSQKSRKSNSSDENEQKNSK